MRLLLAILLAVAVLPAQAETVNICDRTPQLRDLMLETIDANNCAAVDAKRLAGIYYLQYTGTQDPLTSLKAWDFDGLPILSTLILRDNQLTTLPDGVFDGLDELTGLILDNNKLTTLPDGVFDGLTNLCVLDLSSNKLTTLPAGVFDDLSGSSCFSLLDLRNNNLVGLTRDDPLFAGFSSEVDIPLDGQTCRRAICERTPQVRDAIVDALDADDCAAADARDMSMISSLWLLSNFLDSPLTELDEGDFCGLTDMTWLSLEGNELTTLPAGVFDGLTLWTLKLNDNQLTSLPADVFDGLTSLSELYLNDNQLATLPAGVFDGLTSLNDLELSDNELTSLPADVFDDLTWLWYLLLDGNQLATLPAGVFDNLRGLIFLDLCRNPMLLARDDPLFMNLLGTAIDCVRTRQVQDAIFKALGVNNWADVDAEDLASIENLDLGGKKLSDLRPGDFAGLTGLRRLHLNDNGLKTLPDGVFDELTSLEYLDLRNNHLVGLTRDDPLFAGLSSEVDIPLDGQTDPEETEETEDDHLALCDRTPQVRDAILDAIGHGGDDCAGVEAEYADAEDGEDLASMLASIGTLELRWNELSALLPGDFAGLTGLRRLYLNGNLLTTLPAGVFDGLTSLQFLALDNNRLTTLPAGVFDGLTSLQELWLEFNHLTTLPAGVFDGLTSLTELYLNDNQLATLPAGVFDDLSRSSVFSLMDLSGNRLAGLTRDDPLFAGFSSDVVIVLNDQTDPPELSRLAAAVPLMPSTFGLTRQGFVRIVNESAESGSVRVFAFDDGGYAPDPIEVPLGAGQVVHFNTNDLENGNARKGIARGVGGPVQGDWRLDVESALQVRVLAFVRTADGFLTAMHDVLPRGDDGRLAVQTFNPGSNFNQASKLRLVNTGANDERVSIVGVDDQGNDAGPVTLTVPAGESTTLSAFDLENGGAQGLTGTLGDGAGKWRLFITAGESVVGMGLLEAASGHLTNISTAGVATFGGRLAAAVPLMLSASESTGQGFVRIVNESEESGSVRVFAFDDGGRAPDPIEIPLGARQVVHFNSNDLEEGNAGKGIEGGVGDPAQGDWRLDIETDLAVRVLAFVRTTDGFLTAMHDVLPRRGGRLVARTFNPGSNMNQASKLRLVNTGATAESVSIEGVDDQGDNAGPVTLTLPAGESRTLSAFDLENGADGLTGTLGDGAGKWRLFVDAGESVVGMSLLEAVSGHLTNISAAGVAPK